MGCAFTTEERELLKQNDDSRRQRLETLDCRKRSTKVVDAVNENVKIVEHSISESHMQTCVNYLAKHPLFNSLSPQELQAIAAQMMLVECSRGDIIFKQGEKGHSFFVIEQGEVDVRVNDESVCHLGKGQAFGELALLFRSPRAATIVAIGTQNRFFLMRPALYKKTLERMRTAEYSRNKNIVQKVSLFQFLTNKQKFALASSIKNITYKAGEIIFNTGDIAKAVYIIAKGTICISIPGKAQLSLGQYQLFGQASLQGMKRKGRATAAEDAQLVFISRKNIQKALSTSLGNLIHYNTQKWALLRSEAFVDFNISEINKIIMAFQTLELGSGQKMDPSAFKGLVVSLEGRINGQPEGTLFNLSGWKSGKFQVESLNKDQAGAVGLLTFVRLNQVIQQIESKRKLFRASQKCIPENLGDLSLSEFELVRKLGQGQFGQVYLVRNRNMGGHLYAIKCLSKQAVKEQQMEVSVAEEKRVLGKAIFPYIVGFVKAFHDKSNIFLLMQYIKGKQMFDVIREMRNLNKPITRYYFGCIMLSIEYLHANNIVYRDIKPENSVVDHKGKVYLIDMGTAKQLKPNNMFKTFTIIGTPHYMAPEVFEGKGYSFEADYWSLGILLYEFICGKLPFGENVQNDPYALYSIIKRGKIEFPKYVIDEEAKKAINYLLVKDPKQRVRQVSLQRIKKHEYFEGFDWEALLQERILPPYVPRDFRKGTADPIIAGTPFLNHIYSGKDGGKIEEWNEELGL